MIREDILLSIDNSTILERNTNYTLKATLIDNRHCEGRFRETRVYCKSRQDILHNFLCIFNHVTHLVPSSLTQTYKEIAVKNGSQLNVIYSILI